MEQKTSLMKATQLIVKNKNEEVYWDSNNEDIINFDRCFKESAAF